MGQRYPASDPHPPYCTQVHLSSTLDPNTHSGSVTPHSCWAGVPYWSRGPACPVTWDRPGRPSRKGTWGRKCPARQRSRVGYLGMGLGSEATARGGRATRTTGGVAEETGMGGSGPVSSKCRSWRRSARIERYTHRLGMIKPPAGGPTPPTLRPGRRVYHLLQEAHLESTLAVGHLTGGDGRPGLGRPRETARASAVSILGLLPAPLPTPGKLRSPFPPLPASLHLLCCGAGLQARPSRF